MQSQVAGLAVVYYKLNDVIILLLINELYKTSLGKMYRKEEGALLVLIVGHARIAKGAAELFGFVVPAHAGTQ
ncbi:MAG: hypothetical protein ACYCSS_10920 [Sulfuriferula sp.]